MLKTQRLGKAIQILAILLMTLVLSGCTDLQDQVKELIAESAIDGLNVTMVEFVDSLGDAGNYHENIDGSWSEDNSTKNDHFLFQVSSKTKESVFLYDASRDLALDLNLEYKTVNYNGGPLYTITKSSKDAPTRSVSKNAYGITQIEFSDSNGTLLGNFHMNADGTWTEDGLSDFNFTEEDRDLWSIYLYDISRNVYIILDLFAKEVLYSTSSFDDVFSLYTISKSSELAKNGYTVTSLDFTDGEGKKLGTYRSNADGTWTEDGLVDFNFTEEDRDLWSVYLFDNSRNVYIQLDLYSKKVLYSDSSFDTVTPLYSIGNSSITTLSGYNVTKVNFTNGSGIELGNFHQNADGTWSEDSVSEKNRYLFYESARTKSSVFIYDPTRSDIFIELNLDTKTVGLSADKTYASVGKLYSISSSAIAAKTSRVF